MVLFACSVYKTEFPLYLPPMVQTTVFIMPGGFIRREPTDSTTLRRNQAVVEIFTQEQWMSFCDKLQGYDEEVAEEFLRGLRPKSKVLATVKFRGLSLKVTP